MRFSRLISVVFIEMIVQIERAALDNPNLPRKIVLAEPPIHAFEVDEFGLSISILAELSRCCKQASGTAGTND